MKNQYPKVGIGVILIKEEKILLGKRKGAHGEGTWSFPGGNLEYFEAIQDCAKREVEEETGITNIKLLSPYSVAATNDLFRKEERHYITLYIKAKTRQEPRLIEPERCEEWRWFIWEEIPELNLFLPVKNLIKQKYNPFTK